MRAALCNLETLDRAKLPNTKYLESLEKLLAQRLLRLAAGQIFLAKSRADEVLTSDSLCDRTKDTLCESIGRDLNGWFRIAASSAQDSTLSNLLADCVTFTTDSQYHGQAWFLNQTDKIITSDWKTFCDVCVNEVLKANCLAKGNLRQGNLAENCSFVAEYQLENLSQSLRKEIVSLLQKWKINADSKQAQLGLEWLVTDKDLDSYLKRDSAIIFLQITDNQVSGINITYSDIELSENPQKSIPSAGGSDAGAKWCATKQVDQAEVLYDFLVATEKNKPLSGAYRSLLEATEQTACLLSKKYLLGGVRIANDLHPANSASSIHEHLGWNEEDFYFSSAATGARLRLISRKISDAHCCNFESDHRLAPFNPSIQIIGNPRVIQDLSESGITNAEEAYKSAIVFLQQNNKIDSFHVIEPTEILSGGQQYLSIWKGNIQFSFFQSRSNLDLWYTNDSNEIQSFQDCLEYSLKNYL